MQINGREVTASAFAFDGCHKIYLLESQEDVEEATETGYSVYSIADLERAWGDSCGLRFISNWALDTRYVEQFEEAEFT